MAAEAGSIFRTRTSVPVRSEPVPCSPTMGYTGAHKLLKSYLGVLVEERRAKRIEMVNNKRIQDDAPNFLRV